MNGFRNVILLACCVLLVGCGGLDEPSDAVLAKAALQAELDKWKVGEDNEAEPVDLVFEGVILIDYEMQDPVPASYQPHPDMHEEFTEEEIAQVAANYRGFKVPVILRFESRSGPPITKKYVYVVNWSVLSESWEVKTPLYSRLK